MHEMSKPVFREKEKEKNISICHLLKKLSKVLSVNALITTTAGDILKNNQRK